MNRRIAEIRARRARLVERADLQRQMLVQELPFLSHGWLASSAIALLQFARTHPVACAGASAALVILGPKRLLSWGLRALSLWRIYRWAAGSEKPV
jgi:hypothetical protein